MKNEKIKEVLREIIKGEGDCSGFSCEDADGVCPLYEMCVGNPMITYKDKFEVAKEMLEELEYSGSKV